MKKTIAVVTAVVLSGSAYAAGISSGNPDLYGWAVEDSRLLSVKQKPIKDMPLPYGEDTYGAVYFDPPPKGPGGPPAMGTNDSYGSVLHDVGFHW